jgi:glycosyltransferase involved in cell wall biosynthesis
VRLHGRYRPQDLPSLMADVDWVVVPSIWYENAPLVIQEAFQHGKPVICSDIGGMAEAVTDGVDGLHFRAGSSGALADTLLRAATTDGLWESLASGVRPVRAMEDHVRRWTACTRRPARPAVRRRSRFRARSGAACTGTPPAALPAPRLPEELCSADR